MLKPNWGIHGRRCHKAGGHGKILVGNMGNVRLKGDPSINIITNITSYHRFIVLYSYRPKYQLSLNNPIYRMYNIVYIRMYNPVEITSYNQ